MRSLKITFSEWSLPASGSGWWPSSFLVEGVLRSKRQALPLTVTRVVWARQAHLHSNRFRNTAGGKLPFTDRSRFDFPAMWYGIIPPMLVLCHTTWLTGRSLVHLVPEGQRSTECVWSINWWYGSIPHGASGLLIGPRHRNRHVTCGNGWHGFGETFDTVNHRWNDKCEFLARESANLSPILARQWWRHFRLTTSVSLLPSLSLSLSLSLTDCTSRTI